MQLSSLFLSDKDETILKSLVSLLESKTQQSWSYERTSEGDVVIIDLDHPQGRDAWQEAGLEHAGRIRVAYSADPSIPDAPYHLHKPLRARELVNLLNTVPSAGSGVVPEKAEPANPVSERPGQSGVQRLAHLLQDKTQTAVMRIVYQEYRVIIDKSKAHYSASHPLDKLEPLCKAPLSELEVETFSPSASAKWRPLQELLWYSALVGYDGALKPGINAEHIFRLERWPNFKRLIHAPEHFVLSAYMTKNPADIATIHMATGLSNERINDFINACSACGFISRKSPVQNQDADRQVTVPSSHERSGIFGLIRAKLGLGPRIAA